jgi:hypothetical protein
VRPYSSPAGVARLAKKEIEALRENAVRLGAEGIIVLCDEALKGPARRSARSRGSSPRTSARRLIPRNKAFEARGVMLVDPSSSWSGVRRSDGTVVMAMWADAVQASEGGCRYLLWGPNLEGSRPWTDKPAGKERLEHCKLALERGAEGLLVYGVPLEGFLPEDKADSVRGVDPETVLSFQVEKHGTEFWAVWGRKAS